MRNSDAHNSRRGVAKRIRDLHGDRVDTIGFDVAGTFGAQENRQITGNDPIRGRIAVAFAVDRLVAGDTDDFARNHIALCRQ